ncbi:oxidoreductase-related protein [Caenispirillum salinarum AK4]|uniref:Oxidoreductase-related protein n=1 Tax=Caenispirillum salinarum AK4 TaxID=1238182 RepID=K9H464_9PROT|nr:FAD-dependent oxidoreductase [Caenispirillum salinarum]EKV31874.1 oxidoreductase-related protein [Caenispirillum salinarum AK4]
MTVFTDATATPGALPRAPASAEAAKGVRLPGFCGVSGRFAALGDPPPRPALVGDQEADFAVVGAGFVGVAAARRLAELCPDARIALVDAQRVGEGTSGRFSGFVIELPHKGDLEKPDQAHKQRLHGLNTPTGSLRAARVVMAEVPVTHTRGCWWRSSSRPRVEGGRGKPAGEGQAHPRDLPKEAEDAPDTRR